MKDRRRPAPPSQNEGGGGPVPGNTHTRRRPDAGPPRQAVWLTEDQCRALVCALHNSALLTDRLTAERDSAAAQAAAHEAVADLQARLTMPWAPVNVAAHVEPWVTRWLAAATVVPWAGLAPAAGRDRGEPAP